MCLVCPFSLAGDDRYDNCTTVAILSVVGYDYSGLCVGSPDEIPTHTFQSLHFSMRYIHVNLFTKASHQ